MVCVSSIKKGIDVKKNRQLCPLHYTDGLKTKRSDLASGPVPLSCAVKKLGVKKKEKKSSEVKKKNHPESYQRVYHDHDGYPQV